MNRWRFVLTARWARYLVFALVFAAACAGLAAWQIARRDEKVAEISRILGNYDAAPVPLEQAMPDGAAFTMGEEWRPVATSGQYVAAEQLLVRNRPRDGQAGFEVLVPFATGGGRLFLVDRGWVPAGKDLGAPASVPAAPQGRVTVIARLKPSEPGVAGATSASGVLASIQLDEVARVLAEPVDTGAYGLLVSEDPAPPDQPLAAARPALDEGPHLSYAFQWVAFALIGFSGLAFAVRQEYRYRNAEDPDERRKAAARAARKAARPTDADAEDELLDQPR